jgi:hypothetical protein
MIMSAPPQIDAIRTMWVGSGATMSAAIRTPPPTALNMRRSTLRALYLRLRVGGSATTSRHWSRRTTTICLARSVSGRSRPSTRSASGRSGRRGQFEQDKVRQTAIPTQSGREYLPLFIKGVIESDLPSFLRQSLGRFSPELVVGRPDLQDLRRELNARRHATPIIGV